MIPLGKNYCQAVRRGHVGPSGKSSCFILQGSAAAPVPRSHDPVCFHILQQLIIIPTSPDSSSIFAAPAAHTLPSPELALEEKARAPCQPIWGSVMSPLSSKQLHHGRNRVKADRSDPHGFLFSRRGCWHVPCIPAMPANCHSSSDSRFSGCPVTLSSVTQGYERSQKNVAEGRLGD